MNNFTNPNVLFQEEQQFGRRLMFPIALLVLVAPAVFAFGVWQQIFRGIPWGNHPLSNQALIFMATVITLISLLTVWLVFACRLMVVVDRNGIRLKFSPFWQRSIPLTEIREVFTRDSSPILDYGGYGVRLGRKGWAYVISGRSGVQLKLNSGLPVFIGSQHASELAAAIQQAKAV
ncbi:MAG TPA: hypothetical protein VK738_07210 [Terriglobales bacterium]|jgi:hypothetical protein|nr:hypothetical protein [Terriglobales bacterium]